MSKITIEAGLLDRAGEILAKGNDLCTAAIISDDCVAGLYLPRLEAALKAAGFHVFSFVFPHGETSKNAATYIRILEYLANNHLTRTDMVTALGGGVVGDIAGFAAATYLRGVKLVQIPTTLLACVDSSVGGKTGIDLSAGKNLAGAFHQPVAVLIDPKLLDTLPQDVYRDGIAEVIKYACIRDSGLWGLLHKKTVPVQEIIKLCVDIKLSIVERDAFDRGERQLLNFGHTFGHAVEQCSGFTLSHGKSVAIGMAIMARTCCCRGLCSPETLDQLIQMLAQHGLPTRTRFSAEDLFSVMQSDKKRAGGSITLVTLRAIGKAELRKTVMAEAFDFLSEGLRV
jgi:3-dehydroquinate synthase